MEESVKHKIVDIFLLDSNIYSNRKAELCHLLDISATDYCTVKELKPYDFFLTILERWISNKGKAATIFKLWEICKNKEFMAFADKLKETFPIESTPTFSKQINNIDEIQVSFEVRPEVRMFTGRTEELKKLQDYFDGGEEYVVTIAGMGGMGKTELAKRFARSLNEKKKITIIWFSGQNRETLKDSVDRLAKQLGIEPMDLSSQNLNDKFHQSTSKMASKMKKRKLVIIDNVDEANAEACSLIKANLPQKDVFFLITSRNLGVLDFVGKIIELGVFPEADAIALVTTSLEPATNEDTTSFSDGVKKLCQLLGNFPLALQQAISYIKRAKHISRQKEFYQISDYVESYEEKKKTYLGHKLDRINHDYKYTTLFTWQITIDKIEENEVIGAAAIELLNAIAFFEPDRIPFKFVQEFISGDVDEAIELLQTYSLIKCEDTKLLSIHRLLQEVTRLNVFHTAELEMKQLRKITQIVVQILGDMDKELDAILLTKYKIHFRLFTYIIPSTPKLEEYREGLWQMISVWEHDSKHPQLIEDFKTVPVNIIDHLHPLQGRFLRGFGGFVTPFTDSVHSLFTTYFGPNDSKTLEVECMLMLCQWEVLSDSLEKNEHMNVFEEIYERHKSIMAEVNDNPLSLRMRERFIYIFYYTFIEPMRKCTSNWKYPENEFANYCRDFLKSVAKVRGSNAIRVSTIRVRWVLALYLGKEDVEVLELLEELVDDSTSVWGEGHENTREIIGELALCLFCQKQFARAIPKCQRFLHFSDTTHDLQGTVMWILSSSFYYIGDRESAFQVFEDTMALVDKELLKSLFVEMKRLSHSADEFANSQGDTLEAFKKYQKLNHTQRNFFKDFKVSSRVVSRFLVYFWWGWETNQKIASCLIQLDKSAAAVPILQRVIRMWEENAGQDHRLTIKAKELLQKAEKGLTTDWDHPHHSSSSETESDEEIPDWQVTNFSRYDFSYEERFTNWNCLEFFCDETTT